jgi:hypothetical protein
VGTVRGMTWVLAGLAVEFPDELVATTLNR